MQPKNKLTAGLFALLLGQFGVHSFYMGYTARGVWQIILFVCCYIPYVGLAPAIALCVWCIVDGIRILSNPNYCDARGVRLEWNA